MLYRVAELFLARRAQYPDLQHDLRQYWAALERRGHRPGPCYLRMLRHLGLNTLPAAGTLQVSAVGGLPSPFKTCIDLFKFILFYFILFLVLFFFFFFLFVQNKL